MVNSIAEHHCDCCKFVDDITVVARSKPSVPTSPELQRVMLAIRDDASQDHVTLNIAKCSTMRIYQLLGGQPLSHVALTKLRCGMYQQ